MTDGQSGSGGQQTGNRKEHQEHQAMRTKAIGKIRHHAAPGDRLKAFFDDEVENFETMYAGGMQILAAAPTMTKDQLLDNIRSLFREIRLAIDDRKHDVPEIVALLEHGHASGGKDEKH